MKLYPLKFNTVLKYRVWGGNNLLTKFSKEPPIINKEEKPSDNDHIGESWELYDIGDKSSVISNGFLAGNTINEIIEIYLGDIIGDSIYEYFGIKFPLSIKILDVKEKLSVQVHPDDKTALERYDSYGKTEFWYIIDAEEDAKIYMGFKKDVTAEEFYKKCKDESVENLLNVYHPHKGDCFLIEANTVHAAGGGIIIAEIQQSSDLTFRLYDWGREHNPATAREMHLDQAIDIIDFHKYNESKNYAREVLGNKKIADCKHFTVNNIALSDTYHIYTGEFGSFILYLCTEGSANIQVAEGKGTVVYGVSKGELIMIPAAMGDFFILPKETGTNLLEIYIKDIEEDTDNYISEEDYNK